MYINEHERSSPGRTEYISIVTNNLCSRIHIGDIAMAEQDGRHLTVLLKDGCEYSCYARLSNIRKALEHNGMFKVMESMYINFDAVEKIEDGEVVFSSGVAFTIGRNNFIRLRQAYKKYLRTFPPYSPFMGMENDIVAEFPGVGYGKEDGLYC